MFRSRLKRCQPLHPSMNGNALKKSFVSPRSVNGQANNAIIEKEPVKEQEETSHQSQPQSIPSKRKSFVSPLRKDSLPSKTNTIDHSVNTDSKYCFSVMYYKSGPKKKKTYLDGILYIEKKSFSLFESSGKLVKKSLETYDPSGFVIGCTINIGMWELEIGNTIPIDEYASGRIFLQSTLSNNQSTHISTPSIKKHSVSHSKEPTLYTGLYQGNDSSFIIHPSYIDDQGNTTAPIILDPSLNSRMKPHQKEGLVFLYKCVNGLNGKGNGCILADEMGLGKTLTAISLIFTMLTQSPWTTPLITSAVVTCPSSLVENWGAEFIKWLGRDRLRYVIVKEKGVKAEEKVKEFVTYSSLKRTVLVISYEMFRKYADQINHSNAGLLVCDEGHRLKSSTGNATIDCLRQFPSKRRVLLSGTPIQNDMEELYALSSFVNPGVLSTLASFRQLFVKPIEAGRREGSTESEKQLASMRSAELARITEQYILRRTTAIILKTSLPPKITYYLFCKLSPKQKCIYEALLSLQKQSLVVNGNDANQTTLTFLHLLRLLCIHPSLCSESIHANTFLQSIEDLVDKEDEHSESVKSDSITRLIDTLLCTTNESILLISTYTQILDFWAAICNSNNWGYYRLDGSTDVSKRQSMVDSFNNHMNSNRLFLLSAKAGGVGLNITGASRVIMIEPAWNPAIDSQSIARAWRFGQTRTVVVYRFFLSGSIEEVILQRQLLKKDISDVTVDHGQIGEGKLTREEMKELFSLKNTPCSTYDLIRKKSELDSVWKEYGKESVFRDEIVNQNHELFQYIAEEISSFGVEEEKQSTFETLEIDENEFTLTV